MIECRAAHRVDADADHASNQRVAKDARTGSFARDLRIERKAFRLKPGLGDRHRHPFGRLTCSTHGVTHAIVGIVALVAGVIGPEVMTRTSAPLGVVSKATCSVVPRTTVAQPDTAISARSAATQRNITTPATTNPAGGYN